MTIADVNTHENVDTPLSGWPLLIVSGIIGGVVRGSGGVIVALGDPLWWARLPKQAWHFRCARLSAGRRLDRQLYAVKYGLSLYTDW